MRPRTWSDDDLREAVASSENLGQVCKRLGITPGKRTYELLRRHITRLAIPAAHLPTAERSDRCRRSWTDDDLRAVVSSSTTLSQVLRSLGYRPSGGMHRYVRQKIVNLGIDTSHFVGQAWARGRRGASPGRIPLSEILVQNSTYTSTGALRKRLIAEGLKPARCERCGLESWLGEPLPLALDHINGEHTDNRIENLRILCPNCHALTDTWCGRGKSSRRTPIRQRAAP
jgi:hypothetical protein